MARRPKPTPEEEVVDAEIVDEEAENAARERRQERMNLDDGRAFGGNPPPREVSHTELTKAVGIDGELSGLDARLLQMAAARRSPEEMGDETGMAPARAAQRVREILASRDWLSNMEQEILLMQEMFELKNQIQDIVQRYAKADYLHAMDPRWATTLQKLLTDLVKIVDNRSQRVSEARVTIRKAHATLITQAIEEAFNIALHELRERGVVIDESVYRDALEQALPRAFQKIQDRTEAV